MYLSDQAVTRGGFVPCRINPGADGITNVWPPLLASPEVCDMMPPPEPRVPVVPTPVVPPPGPVSPPPVIVPWVAPQPVWAWPRAVMPAILAPVADVTASPYFWPLVVGVSLALWAWVNHR